MSTPAPAFTAVVVVHDSSRELDLLLVSLSRHLETPDQAAHAHRPEVIVVDSGSTDDGAARARGWGAETIVLPHNDGFGAASNAGVGRAASDITVLLNPDVQLLDDGLLTLVARARERDALVAPRLLNADGTVQRSAHPLPGTAGALLPALVHPPLLPRGPRLRAEPWRADRPRTVGWAIGACLVARTDTLRRLGPFDPSAFLYAEDMDLCLRARAVGVLTELHPEVRLRHTGAHATARAFGGEPLDLLARRRREVVAQLGERALTLDDAAQGLTFASRAAARALLAKDPRRELAQLAALRRARSAAPGSEL